MCRKICIYCNKRKNQGSFPKHKHYKDNLDNRCKKCIKQHTKLRSRLRKNAPEKPEVCECCKKAKRLCLDHDHEDNSFRGWTCDKCNTGIGKLGDNLEGLINAVNYLIMTKNRKYQDEYIQQMDSTPKRK